MSAEDFGTKLGRALAALLPKAAADRIRAHYAETYGRCRTCDKPLGGESPGQICEPCHAGEVLAAATRKRQPGGRPS